MITGIANVALLVRDYDEAIAFYSGILGFKVVEDKDMGNGKRWITLEAPGKLGSRLLLSKAATPEQQKYLGKQTGGRVAFFVYTNNFDADYAHFKSKGVVFCEEPRHELYGKVVVFEDLYGNRIDFIEPRA